MKCDKVDFRYRGPDTCAGRHLAELLSEMTITYTYGSGLDKTTVVMDLGSLLRTLDEEVLNKRVEKDAAPKRWMEPSPADPTQFVTRTDAAPKRPTLDDLNRENGVSVVTAVPKVHVRQLEIRQWLQAMNIPFGVPFTAQFVDDLQPSRFDRNPDATEKNRRGW